MSFYLSGDMFEDAQQFGSVLERYWLSSSGVALYVPPDVPLHLSIENQRICFKGQQTNAIMTAHEVLQYLVKSCLAICFSKLDDTCALYMVGYCSI